MAKKPKLTAESKPATKVKVHHVTLIDRGTWWEAACSTCNHQSLVGGEGAKGMLVKWALWHAPGTIIDE